MDETAMLSPKRDALRYFPELNLFPPDKLHNAFSRAAWNWQTMLSMGAMFALYVIGYHPFNYILYGIYAMPYWCTAVIKASIFAVICYCGPLLTRARIRRKMRQELISIGILVCEPCGYDLRGQTEPRCPECGAPFDKKLLTDSTLQTEDSSQHDDSEC